MNFSIRTSNYTAKQVKINLEGKAAVITGAVFNMDESFYKSKTWERKRAAILRRDSYLCQWCKRYGRQVQATTVHHILHLEDRPDLALSPDNLISLCGKCHNKAHPEKGGMKSY